MALVLSAVSSMSPSIPTLILAAERSSLRLKMAEFLKRLNNSDRKAIEALIAHMQSLEQLEKAIRHANVVNTAAQKQLLEVLSGEITKNTALSGDAKAMNAFDELLAILKQPLNAANVSFVHGVTFGDGTTPLPAVKVRGALGTAMVDILSVLPGFTPTPPASAPTSALAPAMAPRPSASARHVDDEDMLLGVYDEFGRSVFGSRANLSAVESGDDNTLHNLIRSASSLFTDTSLDKIREILSALKVQFGVVFDIVAVEYQQPLRQQSIATPR